MRTTDEEGKLEGVAGHGIDLDRARHDRAESIIIVTIGHTALPNSPHPQAQSAT